MAVEGFMIQAPPCSCFLYLLMQGTLNEREGAVQLSFLVLPSLLYQLLLVLQT